MEIKRFDLIEFKALSEEGEFEGYASTFNNIDMGNDKVIPGAFAKTIKKTKGRIPILADHFMRDQIGWNVEAFEDERGLKVHGKLNFDVQTAREKYALAKQAAEIGAKMGLSIGYSTVKSDWEDEIRLLKEVILHEYSILAFPMNERARITNIKDGHLVLATEGLANNIREFEGFLRDAGFSRQRAKTIASIAFKKQRDVDEEDILEVIERAKKALTQFT